MFSSLKDRLDGCSDACLLINMHDPVLGLRPVFSAECHLVRVREDIGPHISLSTEDYSI